MVSRMQRFFTVMLALGLATSTAYAIAGDPPRSGRKTAAIYTNDERRAGYPHSAAPWARPFPDSQYRGSYVGGGAVLFGSPPDRLHGENRREHEGTFGVDYMPWYSRVRLHWFHGRNHQGGEGQYEPDEKNKPFSLHKRKLVRSRQQQQAH
jgi:hypothetical protein